MRVREMLSGAAAADHGPGLPSTTGPLNIKYRDRLRELTAVVYSRPILSDFLFF